jgi:uncharacterized membrane-anchored protein
MTRLSKVPQVTAAFWVIKILTTGMGEALADFFDHAFEPIMVVAVSAVVLAFAIWLQFSAAEFKAWRYWFAVSMVSVFGTLAADAVHVALAVPYWFSTLFFLFGLIAVFAVWRIAEGTISINRIDSPRRETFYWLAVMSTFALGTAAGDMTAITFNWGFLISGLIFTAAFAVPLLANLKAKSVILFWVAYVVTRPLGASFADWLALPKSRGGEGWGTLPVSIALITAIAAFVLAFGARQAKKTVTQAL